MSDDALTYDELSVTTNRDVIEALAALYVAADALFPMDCPNGRDGVVPNYEAAVLYAALAGVEVAIESIEAEVAP